MQKKNDIFIKNTEDDEVMSISTPEDLAKLRNKTQKSNVQLNSLFGGARRTSRGASRTARRRSRQSSRVGRRRSRQSSRTGRRNSRQSARAGRRSSRQSSRSSRRRSRQSSRSGRRRSRQSSRSGRRRSGKQSREEGEKKKRVMPPAAMAASKAFRELATHIAKEMDLKFGALVLKLAGMYNNKAKTSNTGIDAISAAKKAKELFDKDSRDARQKNLREAETLMAEKKAAKKASKESFSTTSN